MELGGGCRVRLCDSYEVVGREGRQFGCRMVFVADVGSLVLFPTKEVRGPR